MTDKLKQRARAIQRDTGWSYTECRRLALEGLTDGAIQILKQMQSKACSECGQPMPSNAMLSVCEKCSDAISEEENPP